MAIQLATNELSAVNDAPFRKLLISNFEVTQTILNQLLNQLTTINQQLRTLTTNINNDVDSRLSAQDQAQVKRLKEQAESLQARINRIIMGTDTEAIKEVIASLPTSDSGVLPGLTYPVKALVSSFGGANFNSLDLYWTNDYLTFQPINKSVLAGTGTNVRDPSIAYFAGKFWVAYTWGVYWTKDLVDFKHLDLPNIEAGADNWAPEWVVDGDNIYLLATAGSHESWDSRSDFKGYWCQFDPVSMAFTTWSTLDYTNPTGVATNIDNTMVKFNGAWWLAMKDEYHYGQSDYAPKIQLYRGANVTGHFDYITDIPFTQQCEGPSLVVVGNQLYCFADGFASYSTWRMSSLDGITWADEVEVKASDESRTQHFTVLPLSDIKAAATVQQAVTYYLPEIAGTGVASLRTSAPHLALHDGINDLYPIQGVEYYYYLPGGQKEPVTALVNLHMDHNRGYSQIHFCIEEGTQPSTIQLNHNSAFVPPYGGDNWQLRTPNQIVTLMTAGSDDGWNNDSAGPYQIIGGNDKSDVETIKMGFLTDSFGIYVGGIKQNYIDYLSNDLSRHSCNVEATRDTIGSTRLTQASDRSDSFCERIGKFQPDLNYLLIQGGTNDWGANMPLGTLGDTTTTSFYGAVDYLIKQAFTNLSTTQLVFLTPTYRSDMASDKNAKNGQGATLTDYIQAIKAVCAKYNVQYIELGAVTGIYPWINGGSLTVDGLHPNEIGHQRIARAIVSQLGL
ncbi:GDSL-type esterase/lipase family protein [Lactiplantibacillus plantarum]|uniref:GDSL-type esterase/lipase family protein n=1 Tax=Lactiplantibacillus plantarum TaxID=1590 RepID=UPI0021823AD6|nr:GDSL-type esterase/lipase family protein [Lactiplantibacillus plantarum]MCT0193862.1 hypothetical protein [Lactiplantibacillus plantarum]